MFHVCLRDWKKQKSASFNLESFENWRKIKGLWNKVFIYHKLVSLSHLVTESSVFEILTSMYFTRRRGRNLQVFTKSVVVGGEFQELSRLSFNTVGEDIVQVRRVASPPRQVPCVLLPDYVGI